MQIIKVLLFTRLIFSSGLNPSDTANKPLSTSGNKSRLKRLRKEKCSDSLGQCPGSEANLQLEKNEDEDSNKANATKRLKLENPLNRLSSLKRLKSRKPLKRIKKLAHISNESEPSTDDSLNDRATGKQNNSTNKPSYADKQIHKMFAKIFDLCSNYKSEARILDKDQCRLFDQSQQITESDKMERVEEWVSNNNSLLSDCLSTKKIINHQQANNQTASFHSDNRTDNEVCSDDESATSSCSSQLESDISGDKADNESCPDELKDIKAPDCTLLKKCDCLDCLDEVFNLVQQMPQLISPLPSEEESEETKQ